MKPLAPDLCQAGLLSVSPSSLIEDAEKTKKKSKKPMAHAVEGAKHEENHHKEMVKHHEEMIKHHEGMLEHHEAMAQAHGKKAAGAKPKK